MKTPQWKFVRRFERSNGIQTYAYEVIDCEGCENKCQRIISEDGVRPKSCQKGE